MRITAIRFYARRAPGGFVGGVKITDDRGKLHRRELYSYRPTEAEALNDATNLAWFIAEKSDGDLSPTRDAG